MHLSRSRSLALLGAAASLAWATPLRAQSAKLRIAAVPTDSYAEPYYINDGGFFSRAGIDVEINVFGTGGQIATAVAGGALDVGIADPIQVGSGFIRGVPFGFFAGGMMYSTDEPTSELCVSKTGPIKTAKDLEGKAIAVNGVKSMAEFATRDWIRDNGGDPAKVTFVEIPPAAVPPALQRGTVAAGMVSEPNLTIVADFDIVPLGKTYDACAKYFYIDLWFARREWIAANQETVRKMVGAIYEGARWANTHRPETLAILAKYAKLDVGKLGKMHRASYDTQLDPKKIQPPLDIAWKYKALERQLDANQLIVRV
jgi:NitT/TauT family transport system substrate-binding protein